MKKTFTVIALVLLAVSCNRYLDIKPYRLFNFNINSLFIRC